MQATRTLAFALLSRAHRSPLLLRQGVRALSTLEELQRRLEAAEQRAAEDAAARRAAELRVADEVAARKAAEQRAATSDLRAETSDKGLYLAGKENFLLKMRSMSGASSVSTQSQTDTYRQGAPVAEVAALSSILRGLPAAPGSCAAVWDRYLARRPASPAAVAKLDERRDVHPSVKALLSVLVPAERMRLWQEERVHDDAGGAHIAPDFTLTAARDASPSVIGALFCIEIKLPGEIEFAVRQACAYMRRRVYRLCQEADDRGEDMDKIEAFGVALDGDHVVLLRMASGAPGGGASFSGAVPCPVQMSPLLPLQLNLWRTLPPPPPQQQQQLGGSAPAGLTALRRLFAAPVSLLGGLASPLLSLRVTLQSAAQAKKKCSPADWGAVRQHRGEVEELQLGDRLGSGGSSDVYHLSDSSSAASGAGRIVKLARFGTKHVLRSFEAERRSLAALAGGSAPAEGLVPQCHSFGARLHSQGGGAPSAPQLHVGQALPWPVLVQHPSGQPLEQWVAARVALAAGAALGGAAAAVEEGAAAATAAARERLACADAVLPRVLRALAAAHAAGWVHCDVRPANIVATPRGAMLVDWGAAACSGKGSLARRGVLAYSASALDAAKLPPAQPAIDAAGALYTWLAVAFGQGCVAPWLLPRAQTDFEALDAREVWVAAQSDTDARVERVRLALEGLEGALDAEEEPCGGAAGGGALRAAAGALGVPWRGLGRRTARGGAARGM